MAAGHSLGHVPETLLLSAQKQAEFEGGGVSFPSPGTPLLSLACSSQREVLVDLTFSAGKRGDHERKLKVGIENVNLHDTYCLLEDRRGRNGRNEMLHRRVPVVSWKTATPNIRSESLEPVNLP